MNNSKQVVGRSVYTDYYTHAFLHSGGVMYDLNDLAVNLDALRVDCLNSAYSINDDGVIVGDGLHRSSNNLTFPFMAVPAYSATPSGTFHGSISPSSVQYVPAGGSVSFTAAPNFGYLVDQWMVNGVIVQTGGNGYTLNNVTADMTVQVTFKVDTLTQYTVMPSFGLHGSISPGTAQTVSYGGSIVYTATPDAGYVVSQWLVNGIVVQTGENSFTARNVTADLAVQVTFSFIIPAGLGDHALAFSADGRLGELLIRQ